MGRVRDFARIDIVAYLGARNNAAAQFYRFEKLCREAVTLSESLQNRWRAALPASKMKVISDQHSSDIERFYQNLSNELFGRQTRGVARERQNENLFGACFCNQSEPLLERADQRRHTTRSNHRCRMRIEGNHCRRNILLLRRANGFRNEL